MLAQRNNVNTNNLKHTHTQRGGGPFDRDQAIHTIFIALSCFSVSQSLFSFLHPPNGNGYTNGKKNDDHDQGDDTRLYRRIVPSSFVILKEAHQLIDVTDSHLEQGSECYLS